MTRRSLAAIACAGLFVVTSAGNVRAASTEEHRALMVAAQLMRSDEKLLRANDLFDDCARQSCSEGSDPECEAIRAFCSRELAELTTEIPTLRVDVVDDRANPLPRATVRMGNRFLASGETVRVDPGHYVVSAEYLTRKASGEADVEKASAPNVVRLTVSLEKTIASRPVPSYVYATIGIGAAALTGMIAAGSINLAQQSSLSACKPTCEASRRGPFVASGIAFDVSLGITVISGVGTFIGIITRPSVSTVVRIGEAGVTP